MRRNIPISVPLILMLASLAGCAPGQETTAPNCTLLGQVLLPPGDGSRGVEVIAETLFNGEPLGKKVSL